MISQYKEDTKIFFFKLLIRCHPINPQEFQLSRINSLFEYQFPESYTALLESSKKHHESLNISDGPDSHACGSRHLSSYTTG